MTRTFKAVYAGGVFRPLESVPIAENQEVTLFVEAPDAVGSAADADLPIWDFAAELARGIPAAELAALPADGAARHDHYLYGQPEPT